MRIHEVRFAVAVTALLALPSIGCETIQNVAPTINVVDPPADTSTQWATASVPSTAAVDRKGWGYANVYFTYAADPDSLFDPTAGVVSADCAASDGSTVLDCEARPGVPAGIWYYQWHIDYGATGADVATLSRPTPATDTFTVTTASSPPPGGGDDDDVEVPEEEALILFDPADGEGCAGTFIGFSVDNGDTIVPLRWRTSSVGEGIAITGDYQVIIEHPASPNCADAAGLDLTDPNTAWPYTDDGGCYVSFTNVNETASPALVPNRLYRTRVRRILDGGGFGDWTASNGFRTASPPAEPPVFVEPPQGGNIPIPDTVVSQTQELLWRMEGCEPTLFTLTLTKSGESASPIVTSGACGWDGDPFLCHTTAALEPNVAYSGELVQSNETNGSITATWSFTTN